MGLFSKRPKFLLWVGSGAALLTAYALWPQRAPRRALELPAAKRLFITNVSVVDPRDGDIAPNMTIELEAGRITRTAPSTDVAAASPDLIVDGRGKFVVPGFNDMHHHAVDAEDPSGDLALMLAEGVTGFRQMSGSDELLQERREKRLQLGWFAPELLAMPGAVLTPFNARSVETARAEVRKQKAEGADFIKVGLVAPNVFWAVLDEARKVRLPTVGHLQAGIDAERAAQAGFHSIEHLGPGAPIWTTCSKDERSLEVDAAAHPAIKAPPFYIPFLETIIGWRLEKILINPAAFAEPRDVARLQRAFDSYDATKCRALAAVFRAKQTWQVPTLVRLRTQQLADDPAYERDAFLSYMPQANVDRWREVTRRFRALPRPMLATYHTAYALNLKLAKALSDAEVPMMTGTDGGGLAAPGMTLQLEFQELARAGISPLKVLQMATTNPAIFLSRTRTMGLIAQGYDANLVLLDANPLESVTNFGRISAVVRAGFYHSASDLQALRDRVVRSRGMLRTE